MSKIEFKRDDLVKWSFCGKQKEGVFLRYIRPNMASNANEFPKALIQIPGNKRPSAVSVSELTKMRGYHEQD